MMRINFFGDVCLDGIDAHNFAIDPAIAARASTVDCNVANLESPLTSVRTGLPYQAHLIKADPKPSRILDLFDVFSLANNHVMDYGEAGLEETLQFLRSIGKGCFGAGHNREASLVPYRCMRGGQQVAFLGFSRWHRATRRVAGAAPDQTRELTRRVQKLSQEGCFVVVYPHWNYEYVDHPAPSNRRIARWLIDAGADLIVGSHPHITHGYEEYKGKWIFHSLGNFVFEPAQLSLADKGDPRINEALILTIDVRSDRSYDCEVVPVHTDGGGVRVRHGDERAAAMQRLEQLSDILRQHDLCSRYFYQEAARPTERMSKHMGDMVRQRGVMYILSRLHRIRLEDLKIKWHSVVSR
jgi:hypothetical protein